MIGRVIPRALHREDFVSYTDGRTGYIDRIANTTPRVYFVVPWNGRGVRPFPYETGAIVGYARDFKHAAKPAPAPRSRLLRR